MKFYLIRALVQSLVMCGLCNVAVAGALDINEGVRQVSTFCRYDLSALAPMLTYASSEPLSPSGVKVIFHLKSTRQTPFISAEVSISCIAPFSDATGEGGVIPDAETVIQDEDAGGRYFRHVASQKVVNGRNWRANVAVIDYIVGDAQRVRKNELLACNADAIAPCISMRVDKPSKLSPRNLKYLYSIFEQIAVKDGLQK